MTGDRVIRFTTAAVVCAVAAFAAAVSYSHIYGLGREHGQDGTAGRLLPLSVDGLILAASLVLLHEARNGRDAPAPLRAAARRHRDRVPEPFRSDCHRGVHSTPDLRRHREASAPLPGALTARRSV